MSTAYPPRFVKWVFSSKKERNAARSSPMKPGFYGHFPTVFGLYYHSPGIDFLSQHFYLSSLPDEEAESERQDLYAVSFFKGPGMRQATIYSTPEHGSAPIAVASNESPYSFASSVKLPGAEKSTPKTEKIRYSGISTDTYTFRHNDEVFELNDDKSRRPRIRRILRPHAGPSQARSDSEAKSAANIDSESDGRVIATWSEGTVPNRDGRLATFRFANSSIAEELGEYWTLLALSAVLAASQQGPAIEGTHVWHEEKLLEKGNYH